MMVEPPYTMWTVSEIEAVHLHSLSQGDKLRLISEIMKVWEERGVDDWDEMFFQDIKTVLEKGITAPLQGEYGVQGVCVDAGSIKNEVEK